MHPAHIFHLPHPKNEKRHRHVYTTRESRSRESVIFHYCADDYGQSKFEFVIMSKVVATSSKLRMEYTIESQLRILKIIQTRGSSKVASFFKGARGTARRQRKGRPTEATSPPWHMRELIQGA